MLQILAAKAVRARYGRAGLTIAAIGIALWPTYLPAAPGADEGALVVMRDYTPLAANTEMARRLLTPLTAASLPARLATLHKQMSDQAIALTHERFRVRVPAIRPPAGYGVIVFIPPWEDAHLPPGWKATLDRLGLIFVSAERSGNDDSPLGRRIPLAVLAASNVMAQYPVDPTRIMVSGFSGGSRVALRVAMAYPDLFRIAIMDAGSDPIGAFETPLPPRDLFEAFRVRSRLIYINGGEDELHLEQASASVGSLKRWCVSEVRQITIPGLGHEVMPGAGLGEAVGATMGAADSRPTVRDMQCWQALAASIDARLATVDTAARAGKTSDAVRDLRQIDARFAGLAAPRSLELARRLGMIAAGSSAGGPGR